jgi:WD40 repeat protein
LSFLPVRQGTGAMSTRVAFLVLAAWVFCLLDTPAAQRWLAADSKSGRQEKTSTPSQSSTDLLPAGALLRLGTSYLRPGGRVTSLVFTPNGKLLASASGDVIRFWDAATGKPLRQIACDWANVLAFARDNKLLASGTTIGGLCLWDAAAGTEVRRLGGGEGGRIHSLAFSPDGTRLASGHADSSVRLWEVMTGKLLHQLTGHDAPVDGLAFSPLGTTLAAGGRIIRMWDPGSGQCRRQIDSPGMTTWLAFISEKQLLHGTNGGAWLWNVDAGAQVRRFPGQAQGAFAPSRKTLVLQNSNRAVQLWQLQDDKPVLNIHLEPGDDGILAVSGDGRLLASAGPNCTIRLWDLPAGTERPLPPGHQGPVSSVTLTTDGASLISTSRDGQLRRWETASGKEEIASAPGTVKHHWLALSPDGKIAAYQDDENSIGLHAIVSTHGSRFLRLPRGGTVLCAAFSPDGKILAAGCGNQPLQLWALEGNGDPRALPDYSRGTSALAFSPDGKQLAFATGEGKMHHWQIATATEVARWGNVEPGAPLTFSPDGKLLAAGTTQGSITLWTVATGKELRQLHGHADATSALCFAADGKTLTSGGADALVRVWEVFSGQEVRRWSGHAGPVTAVAFGRDGMTVVSGSMDSALLVWDMTGRRGAGRSAPLPATSQNLDLWWNHLAGTDGASAQDAMWALIASPKESVPFAVGRLQVLMGGDPERVVQLIANLDDDSYAVREKASAELEKMGQWAEASLRKTLLNPPSLEVQRRVEQILQRIKMGVPWSQERLRIGRSIQILERIASPETRRGLERLTQRAPDLDLREEAQAALDRLARRGSP